MTSQLAILVILVPLFSALFATALGLFRTPLARWIAIVGSLLTCAFTITALFQSLESGLTRYALAGWPAPFGIELILDPLSAFVCCVIAIISSLVLIYGGPSVAAETKNQPITFYSLALILEMGLIGMVMTGDLFNLYVFLEISSLAAYALMAAGHSKAPLSAIRYLYLGTIGGSFYLLGLGFVYVSTGSLNMIDVTAILNTTGSNPTLIVAVILMSLGFAIKMALFPMHGWLPDAYTYASSTATALIAPLMTKVSAYALIRILFYIFGGSQSLVVEPVLNGIAWFSCGGIMIGSIMAMAQRDLKRMLAYSSIGQIAYIGLGIGMGTPLGLIGALLHVLNHALMKACLFMGAGSVAYSRKGTDLEKLRGLGRRMPWTGASIATACLAMVGIPPTVGFFSKWYLVWAAVDSNRWIFVAVILLSSLLTAVYMFRVIEVMYLKKPEGETESTAPEVPWLMRLPMTLIASALIVFGLGSSWLVTHILMKVVGNA